MALKSTTYFCVFEVLKSMYCKIYCAFDIRFRDVTRWIKNG